MFEVILMKYGLAVFGLCILSWIDLVFICRDTDDLAYHQGKLVNHREFLRREFFLRLGGELGE